MPEPKSSEPPAWFLWFVLVCLVILVRLFVFLLMQAYAFMFLLANLNPQIRVIQDISEARRVLKLSSSKEDPQKSQFMVTRLGIDNDLTTSHFSVPTKELREQENLAKKSDEQWIVLAEAAVGYVTDTLSTLDHGEAAPLRDFVRCFVFRMTVLKMYPNSSASPTYTDLLVITGSSETKELMRKRSVLLSRLHTVFGLDLGTQTTTQPSRLRCLLATYDSMEKVVFRGFLELSFRHTGKGALKSPLRRFLQRSDKAEFEREFFAHHFSMKDIINETFRLYPPTARILRETWGGKVEVDVEYIHRDRKSWGDDALCYDPRRWHVGRANQNAFIPFDTGIDLGTTEAVMGPRMLAILIAALAQTADHFNLEGEESEDVLKNSEPLQTHRRAYLDLILRRKSRWV
ncbi:uncharacterized protein LY89DRAFT_672647 [Mollisia scopiformis]|uniref:Cytochrome P450 n=1 Tax=Mollisia scopiformis TaxID=149040 RepID=A0A194WZR0_MOLSC|nr:uncharacterized protein LY89DRAFT_672647 [Mollisia scopiformis]KUJ13433.1 hypothetical protein LY89DRAFT_672647 [Mollisia scopiformis]